MLEILDPSKDHFVGICGPRIRVLCGQVSALNQELKDCFDAIPSGEVDMESLPWRKACGHAFITQKKIEAIKAIIHIALHEDFPELLAMNFVGVRRGWQVVYSNRGKDILRGPDHTDIASCLFYKELVAADKSAQRHQQQLSGR